ncbi:Glucan synthesis regulatory protein [Penicillium canariense]|uniref:Glucan synthesis regulatory protein n=1 Tax=Penicillium canariense TaxID=189055 RepID=A0A9W9I759_9EURO|nr:Glucan synthesis regulatory protein [Penicillium canariense]KAJ5169146.1 Glucan synthesis regulatory protein [Penicillium canariense]
MANAFGSAWRSFWHTMTSYDRHASHDSPYRTGQHVPLSQSRHEPLTSIATSAIESRPDLSSPYDDEPTKGSASAQATEWNGSPTDVGSPTRPYSPGMRSLASQKRGSNEQADGAAEIQMQSFHDGAPPPPPVAHSWRKIERWLEHNYEELLDNLGEGCTQNDINELEHELDCTLPLEVRESLMIHDGQERPGLPTGVLFSSMLLDCEEIVQERRNWKTVNDEFLNAAAIHDAAPPPPVSSSAASSSSAAASSQQQGNTGAWRNDLLDRQDSQPPGAVQKVYAHHGWIPLARDWGGNHIAIDLAPGPAGKWGQVIIFGRDYDCKYVIARSWAAFLAAFADDLCSGKAVVDEETNEMKLKEFKSQNVEPSYLEILRWRADQKYGRRAPRRRGPNGLGANASGKSSSRDSPYGSPTRADERGRSPHRFSKGSAQSPKTPFGVSSPLARVTEETSSTVGPAGPTISEDPREHNKEAEQMEDLMEVATPQISNKENEGFPEKADDVKPSEAEKTEKSDGAESSNAMNSEVLGEMKNVAI